VHQFGIIKWCLNTVDARYKHEEGKHTVQGKCSILRCYRRYYIHVPLAFKR